MRLHKITERAIVALMMFASATGFAQSAAASDGGDNRLSGITLSQGIRAYVEERICDHYARVRVGRPYIPLPLFCHAGRKPTVNLTASPPAISRGQSAVLSWVSARADTCTVSGGWSGSRAFSGTETVAPATTTTYAILCVNAYGIANDTLVLTVATSSPQPTLSFVASPAGIVNGATSTLSWTSANASSCAASGGWSGTRSLSGATIISPATTTSYVLACTGSAGTVHATTTVTVMPAQPPQPTLTFSGNPLSIAHGSSTLLSWSTTGASACTAQGGWSGAKAVNGSQFVSPATTTSFGLRCAGPGGTIAATTTIAVSPAPLLAPTVSLGTSSSTIMFGATSTLSWTSANASSCAASGGWSGTRSLSGATIISPATTTIYVLDCFGLGGTTTAMTTVFVVPAPNPQLTFTADMLTIGQGATSTLNWSSMHVTACTASGGWSGAQAVSGSMVVAPAATTTYVLTCTGLGGTAHGTTTVNVVPVVVAAQFSSSDLTLYDIDAIRTFVAYDADSSEAVGDDREEDAAEDPPMPDPRSLLRRLLGR